MSRTVLILAQPGDLHALAVAAEIQSTCTDHVAILDTANFPVNWWVTLNVGTRNDSWTIHTKDFVADRDQITGLWRRRSLPHRIPTTVRDIRARRFCRSEAEAAFNGWLQNCGTRVINAPAAETAAESKAFQLISAKQVGFKVPRTVITNDPEVALDFINHLDRPAVFKTVRGTWWQLTETRQFRSKDRRYLENLRVAPVIFQEMIEAQLDIRVTVVDEAVFGASIRPFHREARCDWRLDKAAEIRPHQLPPNIQRKLKTFLRKMGLRYGAFDFRLTPRGEYIFLEVNPAGQYLFCEVHAGLPISRAIAASLLGRNNGVPNSSDGRAD